MNLDEFCFEYWKKRGKIYDQDEYCDEIDLISAITNYKSEDISEQDKERLLKCIICKNSRIRTICLHPQQNSG